MAKSDRFGEHTHRFSSCLKQLVAPTTLPPAQFRGLLHPGKWPPVPPLTSPAQSQALVGRWDLVPRPPSPTGTTAFPRAPSSVLNCPYVDLPSGAPALHTRAPECTVLTLLPAQEPHPRTQLCGWEERQELRTKDNTVAVEHSTCQHTWISQSLENLNIQEPMREGEGERPGEVGVARASAAPRPCWPPPWGTLPMPGQSCSAHQSPSPAWSFQGQCRPQWGHWESAHSCTGLSVPLAPRGGRGAHPCRFYTLTLLNAKCFLLDSLKTGNFKQM